MGIPQQQSTAMTITTMIQVAKPTATLPIPLARSPRPLRILTQASNSSWVQLFCTFCSSQEASTALRLCLPLGLGSGHGQEQHGEQEQGQLTRDHRGDLYRRCTGGDSPC